MDRAIEIRKKCQHFRVLVIGRGNAGKTTILKKVCNSTVEGVIFNPSGEQIDTSTIEPSAERGLHNIENEMIFQSNPQFIFHDSRGFECGSVDELKTVEEFIKKRASATSLEKQLHAIWYCLPTDTDRPILAADEIFFKTCGTGKVPVIAIFTKFDGLITTATGQLRESGLSIRDAKKRAPKEAEDKLNANFIGPLMTTTFPPVAQVHLKDMQKESATCSELIERTASAIDDDALKLLFVSVQRNNIDLCIHCAVE
jgi:GTP-binding protein EngB required for normal cell division